MKRAIRAEQLRFHPDKCDPSESVTNEDVSKLLNRLSETLEGDEVEKLGRALKKARRAEEVATERSLQLEKEREALLSEVEKLKCRSGETPDHHTTRDSCSSALSELVCCFNATGKISTFAMSRVLSTMPSFKQLRTVESTKPPFGVAAFTPSGYRLHEVAVNNALDDLAIEVAQAVKGWTPTGDEEEVDAEDDALKASALKLSRRLTTTEQQLSEFRVMVNSALRRASAEHSVFDTDGYLLGGDDGLLETSPTGDEIVGRKYTPSDLVTMSVGYNVVDLENERHSDAFAELQTLIEQILPVADVRKAVLGTMAKITFDGGRAHRSTSDLGTIWYPKKSKPPAAGLSDPRGGSTLPSPSRHTP
eukprot:3397144-Prymnesium_polylepis.2